MPKQKYSKTYNFLARAVHFKRQLVPLYNLNLLLAIVISLMVVTAVSYSNTSSKTKSTTSKAPVHKVQTNHIPPKTIVAAPPPKPVSVAIAPVVTPAPKPKPVISPAKPVHTIVPAPSSSVNNLTPTATPSLPSNGNGSSSSSSSSPATTYTSTNWSGYVSSGGIYTSVSASWIATSPTSTAPTTETDATWIGIGGVTSGDLIQVGTDNTVLPSGRVITGAFYEMLPAASQTVPGITVTPGDLMTASVAEPSHSLWTITITDRTSGQTYSNNFSYASTNSSAEWIEEDPSYLSGSLVPFDNFGTASFNSASTVNGGLNQNLIAATAQEIILVNNSGQAVATPSSIGSDQSSFKVTHS